MKRAEQLTMILGMSLIFFTGYVLGKYTNCNSYMPSQFQTQLQTQLTQMQDSMERAFSETCSQNKYIKMNK